MADRVIGKSGHRVIGSAGLFFLAAFRIFPVTALVGKAIA